MGGYAPASLVWLAGELESIFPSAVLSGIVAGPNSGDSYHEAAGDLPPSSYTRQLEGDQVGIDPNASCAEDVSMSSADMIVFTNRFHASWKDPNDPRLDGVREVIGTRDGKTVTYMDCQSGQYGSADLTHLWHGHLGGLRSTITTMACCRAIRSVAAGETYQQYLAGNGPAPQEEDMALDDIVKLADGRQKFLRDIFADDHQLRNWWIGEGALPAGYPLKGSPLDRLLKAADRPAGEIKLTAEDRAVLLADLAKLIPKPASAAEIAAAVLDLQAQRLRE